MTDKAVITGLILAGGAGRRAGGQDKGLIQWQGRTLVATVAQRLQEQVQELLISCNRNFEEYARIAPTTSGDLRQDYQGPMAGLESAVAHIHTPFVLIAPCDTPYIPLDLCQRLYEPLAENPELQITYAHDGERGQYLCALIRIGCVQTLPAYLDEGYRTVRHWFQAQGAQKVDFSDQRQAFENLNNLA